MKRKEKKTARLRLLRVPDEEEKKGRNGTQNTKENANKFIS